MTKYYIEMKETKRNMMSDALLSLYRKKGPESEEARQMGLKLWDFDLKEKRMEITSDEQRVLSPSISSKQICVPSGYIFRMRSTCFRSNIE